MLSKVVVIGLALSNPTNLQNEKTCQWKGHCLGDICSTYDDCDLDWICGPFGICVSNPTSTTAIAETKIPEVTVTTRPITSILEIDTHSAATSPTESALAAIETVSENLINRGNYVYGKEAVQFLLDKAKKFSKEGPNSGNIEHDCLEAHNYFRELMGQVPMKWSSILADYASNFANQLANEGRFYHSKNNKYGENLYMISSTTNCVKSIYAWFKEVEVYNGEAVENKDSGNYHDWGHMTQMVWPGNRKVGCATANGKKGQYFVCEYSKPGNVMGKSIPLRAKK